MQKFETESLVYPSVMSYEPRTLFRLVVFWCRTRVVADTDTTQTHIIILNYVIFSNYLGCRHVSVCVIFGVRVRIRVS
jgi:hypothetical protein